MGQHVFQDGRAQRSTTIGQGWATRLAALGCAVLLVIAAVPPAGAGPPPERAPTPWGFDVSGMDPKVRAGDSFFQFANGGWLDRTPIPPDKRSVSVTMDVIDRAQRHVRDILEDAERSEPASAPETAFGKIGAFYRSAIDQVRIDNLGVAPLAPELDAIRRARTRVDLARLMGRSNESFFGSLLPLRIEVDWADPTRFGVFVSQPELTMPDRGYYLDPAMAPTRDKFRQYVRVLLGAASWPDADTATGQVLALETALASANWTAAERRDFLALDNPAAVSGLDRVAPGFPWREYLGSAGLSDAPRVVLGEKSAIQKVAALFAATPVETLKAWLAFTVVSRAAPDLAEPVADAFFDFHDRTLAGLSARPPRWKNALRAVAGGDYISGDFYDRFGDMGWAVGDVYVARYFPASAKAAIEAIVRHVQAAYRVRLQRVAWMSEATRAEALRKIEGYRIKVGYPEERRDYSALVIHDDDLIGNVRRAAALNWAYERMRLRRGVSGKEWGMTPQTVNAYHGPFLHEIVFPAGILQAPIFDGAADPAVNYGSIGMTIGHEMTHGLDDQAGAFDAEGRLRDWWAPQDKRQFREKSAVLARQFSQYEALPGLHVDGDLVLGEALADLLGLSVALDAYHASLKQPAPVLDGVTGDQRVFLGFAQYFRGKVRPEATRSFIRSDPHPPRRWRTDGAVRNLDAWYAAYPVQPGDQLYLTPEERVRMW